MASEEKLDKHVKQLSARLVELDGGKIKFSEAAADF